MIDIEEAGGAMHMLLGMYLMARFTRIWRALLKVVTTLLLATRDSFAMTMSVIACPADCLNHQEYHQCLLS